MKNAVQNIAKTGRFYAKMDHENIGEMLQFETDGSASLNDAILMALSNCQSISFIVLECIDTNSNIASFKVRHVYSAQAYRIKTIN